MYLNIIEACDSVPWRKLFACENGIGCTYEWSVCNGIFDCKDFSDEKNCSKFFIIIDIQVAIDRKP